VDDPIGSALLDLGPIRQLVREGLGCQCPEEVFDDVVVGRPAVFAEGPRPAAELLVGRRLLVSLVALDRLQDPRAEAGRLLDRGRKLRDARGLNRFRLVLVGECAPADLEALSAQAAAIDDRLHVHAIRPGELAALLRGGRRDPRG